MMMADRSRGLAWAPEHCQKVTAQFLKLAKDCADLSPGIKHAGQDLARRPYRQRVRGIRTTA
jgi:hypothetical protein